MRQSISKRNKITAFALAICIIAVFFIFPSGFILASTNHTHTCCSYETYEAADINSDLSMCCTICKDLYNAKNSFANSANSNASMFSIFVLLLALYSILRFVFLHTDLSSLISLKLG